MPLMMGKSKMAVGKNIAELMHSGKPQRQSIAIAMSKSGMAKKKKKKMSVNERIKNARLVKQSYRYVNGKRRRLERARKFKECAMKETNTVVKELNEDTSTEDILKQSPDAQEEANTSSESTTEKEPSDTTGEVEKTQEAEAGAEAEKSEEEKEEDALLNSKNPIPYQRFSKTIQQRNEIKKQLTELQQEREDLLSDPDVLRVVLSKQGYNEQQINQQLRTMGVEPANKQENKSEEKPDVKKSLNELVKDLDLSTTDGWLEAQYRIAQKIAGETAKAGIQQYDSSKVHQVEVEKFISTQEKEAKRLSDDVYKIPYGEAGKDEKNPATGVGKISKYLDAHPEDAGLGHVKLLRLALSEEGFKLGEQKGKEEEKSRLRKLKSAAIESDDVTTGKEETPNADWNEQRILEWRKKNPDYQL